MYLVLLFATTTLLGFGRSTNINKHMKMLSEFDNSVQNDEPASKPVHKFLTIAQRPLPSYEHVAGSVLELTCDAVGAPAPSIHWFKNDAPVYEFDAESTELIDNNPTSLGRVVSKLLVTSSGPNDVYTCLATSHSNTARATTVVYTQDPTAAISERTKLYPLEPHIVVTYEMFVDVIGSNVMLPCKAKGHPKPHIVWKDNKGGLVKKDARFRVLRSGELVITGIRWVDMGEYTCIAVNSFGTARATTFLYPAKAS